MFTPSRVVNGVAGAPAALPTTRKTRPIFLGERAEPNEERDPREHHRRGPSTSLAPYFNARASSFLLLPVVLTHLLGSSH